MKFLLDSALFLCIYGIGEILANKLIFPQIMHKYLSKGLLQVKATQLPSTEEDMAPTAEAAPDSSQEEPQIVTTARIKGLLERFTLFLGLAMGIEQVLTLFSALKLGTHFLNETFKGTDHEKISKDYFLIGNLLSVLFALTYTLIWKWITGYLTLECLEALFCPIPA
jgi:hypothetical protein